MRLVDGLPIRSSGSPAAVYRRVELSWAIIRCVPGEAGNRAAISICLEQSKDNRPERLHWKLGWVADENANFLACPVVEEYRNPAIAQLAERETVDGLNN